MKKKIINMAKKLRDDMTVSALAQEGETEMAIEMLQESERKRMTDRQDDKMPEIIHPVMEPAEGN